MLARSDQWKVLIVDDEEFIHDNLEINLRDIEYENKKVEFLHASTAKEAREIVRNDNDIAVIILDVMMEEDSAGLDFAKFVRGEMRNYDVRILLHTGQAGIAPKKEVANKYEIDAYLDKNITDNDDSYAAVRLALRAYKERIDLKNSSTKTDCELLEEISRHYAHILKNWDSFKKQIDLLSEINSMVHLAQEILASYALKDLKGELPLGETKSKRLSFEDHSSLIQVKNLKIILMSLSNERFKKEKVIILDNINDVAKNFSLIKILPKAAKKNLEKYLK